MTTPNPLKDIDLGGRLFSSTYTTDHEVVIHRGGTRSGKTWTILYMAILFLFTGYVKPGVVVELGVFSIMRKTFPALRGSVLRDFEELITTHRLDIFIHQNKTEHTFSYGQRIVEFFSLDQEQKVRGHKSVVAWFNEGNEFIFKDFQQIWWRTLHRVYVDFNPDNPDIWIRTEIEENPDAVPGGVETIVSTYKDNKYLTDAQVQRLDALRYQDPELWQVFGMGNYGKITGLIFQDIEIVDAFPAECEVEFLGLDFGFHPDPAAVVRVARVGRRLYIDEVLYKTGLTNQDLARELSAYPGQIVADSAEPKSIEELRREGLRVAPAVKGPDSLRHGIQAMQSFELCVTASSSNLRKEFRNYKWDSQKIWLPVDQFNHCIDAARYVVQTKMKRNNEFSIVGYA